MLLAPLTAGYILIYLTNYKNWQAVPESSVNSIFMCRKADFVPIEAYIWKERSTDLIF